MGTADSAPSMMSAGVRLGSTPNTRPRLALRSAGERAQTGTPQMLVLPRRAARHSAVAASTATMLRRVLTRTATTPAVPESCRAIASLVAARKEPARSAGRNRQVPAISRASGATAVRCRARRRAFRDTFGCHGSPPSAVLAAGGGEFPLPGLEWAGGWVPPSFPSSGAVVAAAAPGERAAVISAGSCASLTTAAPGGPAEESGSPPVTVTVTVRDSTASATGRRGEGPR